MYLEKLNVIKDRSIYFAIAKMLFIKTDVYPIETSLSELKMVKKVKNFYI